ncbi:MAG: biotin synthase BioB [bacterium]
MITAKDALKLINTPDEKTFELLVEANKLRQKYKGNKVKLCAIVNAKSGKCSENCSFCAQSAHFKTAVPTYPLMTKEEIVNAAKASEKNMSATCFSIVTSGKSAKTKPMLDTLGQALQAINKETGLNRCVSVGTLTKEAILELKANGLKRLHHNLETAESFFDQVCTTHTFAERLQTIKLAKEAELEVCSGGIFGLGESLEQRVELAMMLRDLEVESVPINILHPVPGTKAAENYKPMTPLEVLRLIATYRHIMPKADIGVFGGREKALGELQPLMFLAGANVTLVGDYLTTKGQEASKDLKMIKDLGLEIDKL